MATTLEGVMNLGKDVDDWKAAQAARSTSQTENNISSENPDLQAVRDVNSRLNGHSAWVLGFPLRLNYPSWIKAVDLRYFSYDQMMDLRAELEAEKTADVTFERFERIELKHNVRRFLHLAQLAIIENS